MRLSRGQLQAWCLVILGARVHPVFDGSPQCRVPAVVAREAASVNPIWISIPAANVAAAPPERKRRFVSTVVPGASARDYAFDTEASYYAEYAGSPGLQTHETAQTHFQ